MPLSRRRLMAHAAAFGGTTLLHGPSRLYAFQQGAPAGATDAYAKAKPMIAGPYQPTWESLRDNYHSPAWFQEAKFGIFIHWGLYSIPARLNEWYIRHMYTTDVKWHTEHYGPPDKFGYKDFIPLFTVPKYEPTAWAQLFKQSGARYVVPVAEHHDGFAMWDSDLTPWCAGKMGPKRDLIGELATAVKKQGLIFGLSSHRMEHHDFAYPAADVPNDQFDPRYAGFYGPPIQGHMDAGNASKAFQEDWLARVQELVDKYEPQMIYFDSGVTPREYDDVKLRAAAYYYNRAAQWGKHATFATKDEGYLFGTVTDFEKALRAPRWIYPSAWQCDDALGSTWGYTEGMTNRSAANIVQELIDICARGGNLLLNISPKGDGNIPDEEQKALLAVGEWLRVHGGGIYGSRPWVRYGEGPSVPDEAPGDWKGGTTAPNGTTIKAKVRLPMTAEELRFTVNAGSLYCFGLKYPEGNLLIRSLPTQSGRVERVTLLGSTPEAVKFKETPLGLSVSLPGRAADTMAYGLKIEGTRMLGAI